MGSTSFTDLKTETLESEEEGDRGACLFPTEEGECGTCLFMKGGDCKDLVIAWQDCVKEAEKDKEDTDEKCSEVNSMLIECMVQHSDYYNACNPILAGMEAAEPEFKKELEAEKNKEEEASKMKGN